MGMGYSVSYSNNEDGVIDINGDRYPDWFSQDDSKMKVHFTSPQGDLAEKLTIDNRVPMQEAKAVSGSVGVNGVAAIKATTKGWWTWGMIPSINNTDNACKGMEASSVSFSCKWQFQYKYQHQPWRTWGDINGDGLIDMVSDDGTVSYNVGYGFLPSASIDNLGTDVSESSSMVLDWVWVCTVQRTFPTDGWRFQHLMERFSLFNQTPWREWRRTFWYAIYWQYFTNSLCEI